MSAAVEQQQPSAPSTTRIFPIGKPTRGPRRKKRQAPSADADLPTTSSKKRRLDAEGTSDAAVVTEPGNGNAEAAMPMDDNDGDSSNDSDEIKVQELENLMEDQAGLEFIEQVFDILLNLRAPDASDLYCRVITNFVWVVMGGPPKTEPPIIPTIKFTGNKSRRQQQQQSAMPTNNNNGGDGVYFSTDMLAFTFELQKDPRFFSMDILEEYGSDLDRRILLAMKPVYKTYPDSVTAPFSAADNFLNLFTNGQTKMYPLVDSSPFISINSWGVREYEDAPTIQLANPAKPREAADATAGRYRSFLIHDERSKNVKIVLLMSVQHLVNIVYRWITKGRFEALEQSALDGVSPMAIKWTPEVSANMLYNYMASSKEVFKLYYAYALELSKANYWIRKSTQLRVSNADLRLGGDTSAVYCKDLAFIIWQAPWWTSPGLRSRDHPFFDKKIMEFNDIAIGRGDYYTKLVYLTTLQYITPGDENEGFDVRAYPLVLPSGYDINTPEPGYKGVSFRSTDTFASFVYARTEHVPHTPANYPNESSFWRALGYRPTTLLASGHYYLLDPGSRLYNKTSQSDDDEISALIVRIPAVKFVQTVMNFKAHLSTLRKNLWSRFDTPLIRAVLDEDFGKISLKEAIDKIFQGRKKIEDDAKNLYEAYDGWVVSLTAFDQSIQRQEHAIHTLKHAISDAQATHERILQPIAWMDSYPAGQGLQISNSPAFIAQLNKAMLSYATTKNTAASIADEIARAKVNLRNAEIQLENTQRARKKLLKHAKKTGVDLAQRLRYYNTLNRQRAELTIVLNTVKTIKKLNAYWQLNI